MTTASRPAAAGYFFPGITPSQAGTLVFVVLMHIAPFLALVMSAGKDGTTQLVMPTEIVATLITLPSEAPPAPQPAQELPRTAPKVAPQPPKVTPQPPQPVKPVPVVEQAPVVPPAPTMITKEEQVAPAVPAASQQQLANAQVADTVQENAFVPKAASAPQAAGPRTVSYSEVSYVNAPRVVYPESSRRMRETGEVRVRVLIQPDGKPGNVEIATSSGHNRLDQSALTAVRRAKFKPYMENGQPIAAYVIVPIQFNL